MFSKWSLKLIDFLFHCHLLTLRGWVMLRIFVLRDDLQAKMLWAFLKANWRELARVGKPLQVTVAPYKAKRSIEQNKRYWAILKDISEQAWVGGKCFTTEAWHEHCKRHLIGCDDLPGGGIIGISTTALSVAEFGDYMTKLEAYAINELGVQLTYEN